MNANQIKTIEGIVGLDSKHWTICDRLDSLVMVVPTKLDESPEYRSMIIDIDDGVVVYSAPAITKIVVANRLIETDSELLVQNDETIEVSLQGGYQIIQGAEGVIIVAFKRKSKFYFATGKKLDASQAKWMNTNFMQMYKDVGGLEGEVLFKDFADKDNSPIVVFEVIHTMLQKLLFDDIGTGYIRILEFIGGSINLPQNKMVMVEEENGGNLVLKNEMTFVKTLTNQEAREVLEGENGGFIFIQYLDDENEMNITDMIMIKSQAYQYREEIRGSDGSCPIARLYNLITRDARPQYRKSEDFVNKYFIIKNLKEEDLDKFALEEKVPKWEMMEKAPGYMCTNKDSDEKKLRSAFYKRTETIIANLIFCMPPIQRWMMIGIMDKIRSQVDNVANMVINVLYNEENSDMNTPPRVHHLANIWRKQYTEADRSNDRAEKLKVLIGQIRDKMLLNETMPNFLVMIKKANGGTV